LTGQGRSIAEWMAGLNGRTFLNLSQGRIRNKYLNLWGEDLRQGLLRLLHPVQKGDDTTPVNCLVSGFDIKSGIATCSALVLDTDQMSVVGAGDINLRDETLNLFLQPSPKKALGSGVVGQASLSIGELAKSFKMGGTLAHPALTIDVNRTLSTLSKAFGGFARSGPSGLLEALAAAPPEDKNPCLTAIEAAKKGGAAKPQEPKEKPAETLEGLGKGLMDLFKK
jgi:AsmA family protein